MSAPPLLPGWRDRLGTNQPDDVLIVPTGKALGAEVVGVDLSAPLDAALIGCLKSAWLEHLVLLFRGQSLDPRGLVGAAATFGEPEVPAAVRYYERSGLTPPNHIHRNIMAISNLGPEGLPVAVNDGLGSGEVVWHSDNSYIDCPPSASMLYALEVPPQGGDTWFNNQYEAYGTLPEKTRDRIASLGAVHDSSRNSAGVLRPGVKAPTTLSEVPGPTHPLVRRHPDTGRPALYLGRRRAAPSQDNPEVDEAESEALLDELWAHATHPDLAWSHQWRAGDVVLWDNRCAMHRRDPHDPRFPRIMHRVQLAGTAPEAFQ